MKKSRMHIVFMILSVFALLPIIVNAENNNFLWAKQMGGALFDTGSTIVVDSVGSVYTMGVFSGTADFGPDPDTITLTSLGERDVFVSKTDSNGGFVWVRQLGGIGINVGYSIATDSDGNVYTTGEFYGATDFDPGPETFILTSVGDNDVFLSKLNVSGDFVWAKQLGGTGKDVGLGIAVDRAGYIYTTGEFNSTVDFDPGEGTFNLTSMGDYDIFVLKLDENGNFVWATQMGGIGYDMGSSISVDSTGSVYTMGTFVEMADFDPSTETFILTSLGGRDVFVSKLEGTGEFVWAKQMGGNSSEWGSSIALDSAGNVCILGRFEETVDFDPGPETLNLTSVGAYDTFVSKLDREGDLLWVRQIGGKDLDLSSSIAVERADNVYITGGFKGTADFDPGPEAFDLISIGGQDIFVLKIDANGDFIWAEQMGGGTGYGSAIDVDSMGNVYTTGMFFGTVDFRSGPGTYNLTSAGSYDIFLSKFGTDGVAEGEYEGLEADVAPRSDGDGQLLVNDWVQVGRFVAGLDIPSPGSEFQRADCAPYATAGDGQLLVNDWVQTGRYVAGLDVPQQQTESLLP